MDYVTEKLEEKGESFNDPLSSLARYEIVAFINGKQKVLEIRDAVSAEWGPVSFADVLESIGLIFDK